MSHIRGVGLLASLVIVGVLGGLTAPLPADAGNPTLTIDGLNVPLTQGGPGCGNDTGFINGSNSVLNSCYALAGTNTTTDSTRTQTLRIGNWYIGDYTSTNQARVLINDTATGTDNMKLTGVTFSSAINTSTTTNTVSTTQPCSSCQVGNVVLQNHFSNAPNGTGSGANYTWGMGEGGYFDPPGNENVINDRFKLAGIGCFTASPCNPDSAPVSLGSTLDTGTFASSTVAGLNGGVSKSNSVATVKPSCNTGSGKCAPTLKYTYTFTVQGIDKLTLTDSVDGCGGLCSPDGPTNKLPACTGNFTPPSLHAICDATIAGYNAANLARITEDGGVISETCEGTCIVIQVKGTPDNKAEGLQLDFTATGQGVGNFSRTLDEDGMAVKAFSPLVSDTNPAAGDPVDRVFTILDYPAKPNGDLWQTDQINCSSGLNNGSATWTVGVVGNNSADKISVTVHTIADNDILTCLWHVH